MYYVCPECGYEGPHSVVEKDGQRNRLVLECGGCYVEFEVYDVEVSEE